jgi:peptidoglycan/xylan/chitin deacetylase (PgdA/CDA1 family)
MMRERDENCRLRAEDLSRYSDHHGLNQRLPVVLYHGVGHVSRQPPHEHLVVPTEKFEAQIRALARSGHTTIRINELLRWQREGVRLPAKPVLITFDDAFEETAEHAFPVLRRYGMTAIAFVITSLCLASGSFEGRRVMTREQIKYWAQRGIEFGSHTCTHADLSEADSLAIEREVFSSAREFEEIVGEPASTFAYPYGRWSESVRHMVAKVYSAAFTCEEGLNLRTTDSRMMRRTMVNPKDTVPEFLARLRYGRNPFGALFKPYRILKRITDAATSRNNAAKIAAPSSIAGSRSLWRGILNVCPGTRRSGRA